MGVSNSPTPYIGILHSKAIVREGLRSLLERSGEFRIAIECSSPGSFGNFDIQLAILELSPTVIDFACGLATSVRRVFVTMDHPDAQQLIDAIGANAVAFVDLDEPGDVLLSCRAAVEGRSYLSPHRGLGLLREVAQSTRRTALTDQEMRVLLELTKGQRLAEIGSTLYLSTSTVKSHLARIYQKLGVSGKKEAIMQARNLSFEKSSGPRPARMPKRD